MKNSTCYNGTGYMDVKGILWHSTGVNNPWLKRYVQPYYGDQGYDYLINYLGYNANGNDWNHSYQAAGVNAWIGKAANGEVTTVQTLPWNFAPWGCGGGWNGTCNNGWIQFEICEDSLSDPTYFNEIYKEACELTAYLCDLYNINPKGTYYYNGINVPTILCHYDSYNLGLGTGHVDVTHWFSAYGKTMDDVRNDVAKILANKNSGEDEEEVTQEQFNEMMNVYLAQLAKENASGWSKSARQWAESNGIIKGDEKGNKMYKKFVTREELASIAERIVNLAKKEK